ncbi:MAG: AraC family transcriptional regulator, partial [Lachnospiraceae bacterium]|nr:AraC family transcriptional regulator [Lachnospiraceae bacterium]
LKEEKYRVYEVADILNFSSEFYFSKVFKKIQGVTPSEYLSKP